MRHGREELNRGSAVYGQVRPLIVWGLSTAPMIASSLFRVECASGLESRVQLSEIRLCCCSMSRQSASTRHPGSGCDPSSVNLPRIGRSSFRRTCLRTSRNSCRSLPSFPSQLAVLSEGELIFEGSYSDLESVGQKHPVRNANDAEAGYLTLLGEAA